MRNLSPTFLNFKIGLSQFANWTKVSQPLLLLSLPLLLSLQLATGIRRPSRHLTITCARQPWRLVISQLLTYRSDPLLHVPIFSSQSSVNCELSPSFGHFHQPNLLWNNSIFFISFPMVPFLPSETHWTFGTLTSTPTFWPNEGNSWNEMTGFLL